MRSAEQKAYIRQKMEPLPEWMHRGFVRWMIRIYREMESNPLLS